ncbi:hypothetical protein [Candidatus Leptofilum sp.]|uniref:hypothetical protein n=1 Tax=Candidatus Leptofilum sp. TaxID=3241576 RepID=UPI003B5CE538
MKRVAGIVLILGVICFMIGVSRPVILDYFGPGMGSKAQLIRESPDQWQFGNLMMGFGSIIVAVGVATFTLALRSRSESKRLFLTAVACACSISLAAAYWMIVSYNRSVLPPLVTAKSIRLPDWTWPAFNILMPLGIVLLGFIIMQRYSKWGGGLIMAIEVISVATQQIITQDIIPGTHFLPLLIAGISLLIFGGVENTQNPVRMT